MRIFHFFLLSIISFGYARAQAPDWHVDASKYNYSMVMVGIIKVDGVETTENNDRIAAFIDGEVRGVAMPVYQEQVDRNIFYLIIYHNDDGGNVTFKFYDATANVVTTTAQTIVFSVDGLAGDAFKPFVWSNRVTNTEARILAYSFPDQLGSKVYTDSVVVRVDEEYDLSSVAANFTLAEGAALYVNGQLQQSGITPNDFSGENVLTVRSEDEQTVNEYVLRIRREKDYIPNILFLNGTEQNRTWGISHLGIIESVKINVFDQNGHAVFTSADPQYEWDGRYRGTYVPEGVYFYSIEREDGSKRQGSIQVIY